MGIIGAIILMVTAHQCLAQPPGIPPQTNQPPTGQPSHGHGHHAKPLEFASEVHNRDHILEHLQQVIATKSKDEMTEEELEFHYFKLHDYDNNNKLDGVEIGKALTHFHDDDPKSEFIWSDAEFMEIVDDVLRTDDITGDGYIDYAEFMASQNSAKTREKPVGYNKQLDDLQEVGHLPSSVSMEEFQPPGTPMEMEMPDLVGDSLNYEDGVILRSGHQRQQHQQSQDEYERQNQQERDEQEQQRHRVLEEHRQLRDQYIQMQKQQDIQQQNQEQQQQGSHQQQIHHLHQQQQYHSQTRNQEQDHHDAELQT